MACEPEGGIRLFVLNLIIQHVTDLLLLLVSALLEQQYQVGLGLSTLPGCGSCLTTLIPLGFEVVSATPDVVVPILYHGSGRQCQPPLL